MSVRFLFPRFGFCDIDFSIGCVVCLVQTRFKLFMYMAKDFYSSIATFYDKIFPLQPPMLEFVLKRIHKSSEVLDIGCATGLLAAGIAPWCKSVRAFDLDPQMVAYAVDRVSVFDNVQVQQGNMLKMRDEIDSENFDCIVCVGNTIVHLPDNAAVKEFISQIYQLLSLGGVFIVQLLNYKYVVETNLTHLPLIENEHVRFERAYEFIGNQRVEFNTKLHVSEKHSLIENSSVLLCLYPETLFDMLEDAGFINIRSYESWTEKPLTNQQLPLIVEASKAVH